MKLLTVLLVLSTTVFGAMQANATAGPPALPPVIGNADDVAVMLRNGKIELELDANYVSPGTATLPYYGEEPSATLAILTTADDLLVQGPLQADAYQYLRFMPFPISLGGDDYEGVCYSASNQVYISDSACDTSTAIRVSTHLQSIDHSTLSEIFTDYTTGHSFYGYVVKADDHVTFEFNEAGADQAQMMIYSDGTVKWNYVSHEAFDGASDVFGVYLASPVTRSGSDLFNNNTSSWVFDGDSIDLLGSPDYVSLDISDVTAIKENISDPDDNFDAFTIAVKDFDDLVLREFYNLLVRFHFGAQNSYQGSMFSAPVDLRVIKGDGGYIPLLSLVGLFSLILLRIRRR